MSSFASALLALLISTALLTVLALRDPKRLRNLDSPAATPLSRRQRRWLGWLVPAPGLVLAIAGSWPAFLIWLGASCSLGWSLTQLLAPASARADSDGD